jgi:hypothetical protein
MVWYKFGDISEELDARINRIAYCLLGLFFHPEDGDSKFFRNVGTLIPA